jgi:RNA polymerase sigma-70 factor (ECF subfamily)
MADWARLLEGQVDYVYRTLQRLGARAVEIDDLVQEVFLVMCRQRSGYDPGRPLRPWIVGIAFRVIQEGRRRGWRELPQGFVDAPDEAPSPEQHLATVQARTLVLSALARLPAEHRMLLIMRELDDVPMREIADTLSVSLFTLYSRLKRAKVSFAKEVRRAAVKAPLALAARQASPASLLASESQPLSTPAGARRRALARLRALLATPAAGPGWAEPDPGPAHGGSGVAGTLTTRSGLALALLVLVVFLVRPSSRAGDAGSRALRSQPALEHRATPLDRGLVGYWRFDDRPGSASARDSSTGANHCVLRRLDPDRVWQNGEFSGALSLTGRGWLECPQVDAIDTITDEITIAAWVTRGTDLRNYRALVARQKDAGREDEFMFGFANGDLMFASHRWRGKLTRPLPPQPSRRWFHVGATRHGDGTTILYVNGVELGREITSGGSLGSPRSPLLIGGALNGPDPSRTHARFDGGMDELVIYRRALSQTEMAALAAGQQPAPSPDPHEIEKRIAKSQSLLR